MANTINMAIGGGSYPPVVDTLENTSWIDINTIAATGEASTYWQVGDTKTITFASAVFGSTVIVVKILGFDYDDLADSSGKAPITFGMVDCFALDQLMNNSDTTVGGWGGCAFRVTLINSVLPALKDVIGTDIIKPVSKRTSAGNLSTTINTTTDEAWLLSEYEVFGATTYTAPGEKPPDKNICYPAFTDTASRIKSDRAWWMRSPRINANGQFCRVAMEGISGGSPANTTRAISIGFCV